LSERSAIAAVASSVTAIGIETFESAYLVMDLAPPAAG
jgi:hypothetical protein